MITVFTNGCFDLLHVGHVEFLRRARELGDSLTVLLNSDRSVRRTKGAGRPVFTQGERYRLLSALKSVSQVWIFDDEEDLASILRTFRPSILAKGSDWRGRAITGAQYAVRVEFLDCLPGYSTTRILERIRG